MSIASLRREYHRHVGSEIVRITKTTEHEYPNFADGGSNASRAIAWGIVERMSCTLSDQGISGQTAGRLFESATERFVRDAFRLLEHLRPGRWHYSIEHPISEFDQYAHLAELERTIVSLPELASSLGTDYIIKPDIVVSRERVKDDVINAQVQVIDPLDQVAGLTPLRKVNYANEGMILHASISCKWTLRSDRAQNARAEALNLIRNRKGNLPHIVAVTAEPLPTRIAALALGTGDLDCVYHFALYELLAAIQQIDNEDQLDMLNTLVDGRRLRDISDLPFDLAI